MTARIPGGLRNQEIGIVYHPWNREAGRLQAQGPDGAKSGNWRGDQDCRENGCQNEDGKSGEGRYRSKERIGEGEFEIVLSCFGTYVPVPSYYCQE